MSESSREKQLEAILHGYLQAIDAGQNPDREELLRRYPDFADELREFFTDQEKMDRMAQALNQAHVGDITLGVEEAANAPNGLPRIRYFGDYELQEEIARGGMGVVFKARQVSLNRSVALKMILKGELANEADVRRFRDEAEAAANLDHPHIVPIYEIGVHDGQQYFSMKLIGPGRRRADLGVKETVRIMILTARAVHHAHQRGILHRDLKPGNILFDENGAPHVADFGLAKRVGGSVDVGMTRSGAIVGTPSYMAPEQARAEKVLTTAVDVYSLGAILYEWLTGQPPFRGNDVLATLFMVATDEPPRPRTLNPRIDRDLETICLKCLNKDPARRYGSADLLAEDLERWLAGEPIVARPVGSGERLLKWVKRRPMVAALLATVVLVTLAGVGGITWALAVALEQKVVALEQKAKALEQKAKADNELLRAEWLLYTGQIAFAQREWQAGDVGHAWQFLKATRQDFRAWEHDYLYTLFNSNQHTFRLDNGARHVVFSPDGQRLAVVSFAYDVQQRRQYGVVMVLDAQSGQTILTLKGHTEEVTSVAFSPDGKRLVSGGGDYDHTKAGEVIVWDAQSGQEVFVFKRHSSRVRSVAFSPDGKRVASGGGQLIELGELKVWDADSGKEVFSEKARSHVFASVAFSPDGVRIASGTAGNLPAGILISDAQTGKEILTIEGASGPGSYSPKGPVGYSPDGKWLAGGSKVWDARTGKEILTFKGGSVLSAFSSDSKRLAGASHKNEVKVWDGLSGQEIVSFKGHAGTILSVALSQDGQRLASAGEDGTVKMWDMSGSQETLTLSGKSVAFSSDSKLLASTNGTEVKLWDVLSRQHLRSLKGHTVEISSLAFSPDGQRLASASGNIFDGRPGELKVWDARTGEELLFLKGHIGPVTSVAFSPDGKRIASGGGHGDPTVRVWDAQTGQEIMSLQGDIRHVTCVAFRADGKRLVSAYYGGPVKVWDVESGREVLSLTNGNIITGLAFSPDGKRIAGAAMNVIPGSVCVWDAESGRNVLTLIGHTKGVCSVAFSPDGKRIASGSVDKTVKVWEAQTGQELLTLQEHAGPVWSVAFSPDGRRLASGSEDGTVKVWDGSLP